VSPHAQFNPGQAEAFDQILAGNHHVTLLSGPAGTGKSFVIDSIVAQRNAIIVAPTGVAAINVGGETIHSAFGIRPVLLDPSADNLTVDGNFRRLHEDRARALGAADLLIIDEVSMVRADLLDALDRRLRILRNEHHAPFGGLQTVLVGDSFQLPPVLRREDERAFRTVLHHDGSRMWKSEWWFGSRVIREAAEGRLIGGVRLTQPMRQDDTEFIGFLNRARRGKLTSADLRYINSRVADRPLGVTVLHSLRRGVDAINKGHLDELPGPDFTFYRKVALLDPGARWNDRHHPQEQVRLRAGALVSLTTNYREHDDGKTHTHWVNGDTARVVAIDQSGVAVRLNRTGATYELVAPDMSEDELRAMAHDDTGGITPQFRHTVASGRVRRIKEAVAAQVPLRVAAALTVHKSQGQTLDAAFIGGDLSWAPGLAYVALSRVRTTSGLFLEAPLSAASFRVDPRVVEFNKALVTLRDLEALI
jgi:hypothetical protein